MPKRPDLPTSNTEPSSRRAVSSDSSAIETLYRRQSPYYRKLAKRLARNLPPDLAEEAFGEMWLRVIVAGRIPFTGSGVSEAPYFTGVLRNSVRSVSAAYRPAGSRSRRIRETSPEYIDNAANEVSNNSFDRMTELQETRIDLELLLRRASPKVRKAANLILMHNLSVSQAAERVGLGRMTLSRALRDLGKKA